MKAGVFEGRKRAIGVRAFPQSPVLQAFCRCLFGRKESFYGNETKERLPLRMKPETSRRLEQWYAADNCRSKNEFVEKAVNFYVDYLEMQDNRSLPTALPAVLDGRMGRLEDLIARQEYTREVELDMVIGIIADCDGDRPGRSGNADGRRAFRNVKATNGLISLEKRARAA